MTDKTIPRAFLRRIYELIPFPVRVEYHLQDVTVVHKHNDNAKRIHRRHVNGLGC